MNFKQFCFLLNILVVAFITIFILLSLYYDQFTRNWGYEIWVTFLGLILITSKFQVPNEADYVRASKNTFLSSVILLRAKDFSDYRLKQKAFSKIFFYSGLILVGILILHIVLKLKGLY